MKHLAIIQLEFLKAAVRKWDDLTLEEQRGYLKRHPKSKRRLTARQPAHTPLENAQNKIKVDMAAVDKYIRDSQEKGDDIKNVIPTSSLEDIEAISDAADKPAFELEQDINEKGNTKVEDIDVGDITSVMETISAEHLKEVAEAIKSGKMDLDKTAEKITAIRIGSHINLLGGNHRCSVLILSGAESIKMHVINIEDIDHNKAMESSDDD